MLMFFLQIDWSKWSPEALFGGQVLERTPAGLTIVYIVGVGVLLGFLILSFFDNFNRPQFLFEASHIAGDPVYDAFAGLPELGSLLFGGAVAE